MIRGGGIYEYCSAINLLIISQLGVIAEYSLFPIRSDNKAYNALQLG